MGVLSFHAVYLLGIARTVHAEGDHISFVGGSFGGGSLGGGSSGEGSTGCVSLADGSDVVDDKRFPDPLDPFLLSFASSLLLLTLPSLLLLPLAGTGTVFSSLFVSSFAVNFVPLFLEGSEENGPFSVMLEVLIDVVDDGDNEGCGLILR